MNTDKHLNQTTSDRISDLEYNIAFRNKMIEYKDDLINRYQKILIEKTPNMIYINFTFSNS